MFSDNFWKPGSSPLSSGSPALPPSSGLQLPDLGCWKARPCHLGCVLPEPALADEASSAQAGGWGHWGRPEEGPAWGQKGKARRSGDSELFSRSMLDSGTTNVPDEAPRRRPAGETNLSGHQGAGALFQEKVRAEFLTSGSQ